MSVVYSVVYSAALITGRDLFMWLNVIVRLIRLLWQHNIVVNKCGKNCG